MIAAEAAAGPQGRIVMKLNGLTDPEMIDALYVASRAGVPIDLNVRGMCCLRPGIPELSETIRVRSIVGQFLEHSRIYRFGGQSLDGTDERPLTLLIGSADLMERNLDRRVEVLTPVRDPLLQARLLEVLELCFADDTNTWALGADRRWRKVPTTNGISVQDRLRALALERARRRREPEPRPPSFAPARNGRTSR
jgi:polyphosphate kinase